MNTLTDFYSLPIPDRKGEKPVLKKNPKNSVPHPSSLEEKRRQGTVSFPYAKYTASENSDEDHTSYLAKPHWHQAFEFLYFEEGEYTLGINTESIEVHAPSIAFIEPNSLHSIRKKGRIREHAILFRPEIVSGGNADAARHEILDPLEDGKIRFPLVLTPADPGYPEVETSILAICRVFETNGLTDDDRLYLADAVPELKVRAHLLAILAELSEHNLLKNEIRSTDPRAESLKDVVTYIREHYEEKIYIRDLAAIMHMSEQYFIRFFHKTIGRSPQRYICEIRMREALLLIEQTSLSVTEIAGRCGFASVGLFIEEFKKQHGTTPFVYRKRYRG